MIKVLHLVLITHGLHGEVINRASDSILRILQHFQVNNTDMSCQSLAIRALVGKAQHIIGNFKTALKTVKGDKLSFNQKIASFLLSHGTTAHRFAKGMPA